jgi:hypothetical protein
VIQSLLGGLDVAAILIAVVPVASADRATLPNAINSVTAACRGDASSVEAALDAYYDRVGRNPATLDALTSTSQGSGSWLRRATSTRHYTIVFKPQTDEVYVYPPDTPQPETFSQARYIEVGNPCKHFAS